MVGYSFNVFVARQGVDCQLGGRVVTAVEVVVVLSLC